MPSSAATCLEPCKDRASEGSTGSKSAARLACRAARSIAAPCARQRASGSMRCSPDRDARHVAVAQRKDDPFSALLRGGAAIVANLRMLIKSEASAFGAVRSGTSSSEDLLARSNGCSCAGVDGPRLAWTRRSSMPIADSAFVSCSSRMPAAAAPRRCISTAILNSANRLYGGAVIDTAGAMRLIVGETIEAWQVEGAVPTPLHASKLLVTHLRSAVQAEPKRLIRRLIS